MGAYALAQAGDADALSGLVRQHIPLVQALCRRFSFCDDAFQQGCMGLVKAIRKFREDAGYQFSTYAVPVILGEMRRAYAHHLGWRTRAALKKAKDFQDRQLRLTGRMPTILETALQAGVAPEELVLLLEKDQGPVYDETGRLIASLPDPQGENWLIRFYIRDILSRMPGDESWLIRQRFILGRSQQEVAAALRSSQSRVSRKEKQARLHFQCAWNAE